MTPQRPLCIGLSLAATWLMGNGWRRADSRVEDMFAPDIYCSLARRAEAAKMDFLFRPDTLFLNPQATAASPGFSSLDPTVLLAAIAHATQRIGLVSTASTTFYPPYVVARQMQSLNWISHGRAGWNVVTALDGQQNFGLDAMPPAATRYASALEFTRTVRALWHSYPQEALLLDRAEGRYADPDRIRAINHDGPYHRVAGPLNLPAHAAGAIPLFQAGASDAGRDFAARIADGIFAATPDIAAGVELRADLRRRAAAHGRNPDAIRVLPGLSLYLAHSRAAAQELFHATHAGQDMARHHATLRANLGLDLAGLPPDHPVTAAMLPTDPPPPRSQTHATLLRRLIARETLTVAQLLARPEVAGSGHWAVIGTAEDAVTAIVQRVGAGAADGFIALPGGSPGCIDLIFDDLMPRLSDMGLFRKDYTGSTLRSHLGMDDIPA